MPRFASEAELENLVKAVESCEFPLPSWHHDAHLAVTCWYLARHGRAEATRRLRTTIQRFNAHHRIPLTRERGYHETLTLAWIAVLDRFLAAAAPGRPLPDLVQEAIRRFADKRYLLRYYSRERMMSWEARLGWVEPDVQPLEE